MKPTVAVASLSFCILLMFVADANSLKCHFCDDGKCKSTTEEECKPATAATAAAAAETTAAPAARFIERDDETPAPAAAAETAAPFTPKCVILKYDGNTYKGCSPTNDCKIFASKATDVSNCKTCDDKDLCNSGLYIKPSSLFFTVLIALTSFVISSR